MKTKNFNFKYKEQLKLMAHGRGRRERMGTRIVPQKTKGFCEKDLYEELEELGIGNVKFSA